MRDFKRDIKISLGLNLSVLIITCVLNYCKMPIGWANVAYTYKRNIWNNT